MYDQSYDVMFIEDNADIRLFQLRKVLKIYWHMHFCRSGFLAIISFRQFMVFLIIFWSNKYYLLKLMALSFRFHNLYFIKKFFCWLETCAMTFKSIFMLSMFEEYSYFSWNTLETVFYDLIWKKNLTV